MAGDAIPNEDEQVLAALAEAGHDLTQPMLIEFELLTDSEESAEAIADAAESADFSAHVYAATPDEEQTDVWVCVCARNMTASIDTLTTARQRLETMAAPHGGHLESWGTFGNSDAGQK